MLWTLPDAQSRLREVIDLALTEGPQHICTDGGRMVLVSTATSLPTAEQDEGDFLEFLRSMPVCEELVIERDKSLPRVVNFDED